MFVLFLMGSREFYDHIWALTRHFGHVCCMLDSEWSKKILLLSDWLGPIGASFTTDIYCQSSGVTQREFRINMQI